MTPKSRRPPETAGRRADAFAVESRKSLPDGPDRSLARGFL